MDEDYCDKELESKEKFSLLKNFFQEISNGKIQLDYKWKNDIVCERVSHNRAKLLDSMVQILLETIFPDGSESVYQEIIDDAFGKHSPEKENKMVLHKLVEAYKNTQEKQIKKFLVMELTLIKKFDELKMLLPGFTYYQYKAAQKTVKESGLTKLPSEGYQNVTRNRRDIDSTVHFVQFFLTFVRVRIMFIF